jgi:hypothetical protein
MALFESTNSNYSIEQNSNHTFATSDPPSNSLSPSYTGNGENNSKFAENTDIMHGFGFAVDDNIDEIKRAAMESGLFSMMNMISNASSGANSYISLSPPASDAANTPPSLHSSTPIVGGCGMPDEKTSLWMGDLDPWMDEPFIRGIWAQLGENVAVKMIRDKFTG